MNENFVEVEKVMVSFDISSIQSENILTASASRKYFLHLREISCASK